MEATVIYRQNKKSQIIEIKPNPKGIVIFGMWFFCIIPYLSLMILGLYIMFTHSSRIFRNGIDFLIILVIIIGSSILVGVFLKKIYQKEIIIITDDLVILTKFFLIKIHRLEFHKNEIKDLKYLNKENFTRHPLEPNGFDYLGLGNSEREMQFFIDSGKLAFYYNGTIFRFGKNLYEDDGWKIIEKINKSAH